MSSSTARSGSTLFSAGGGRNNRGAARGARSTEERNGETDSHTAGKNDPFIVRGSASGHTSSCSEEEGVMAFPSELTSGVQAVRVPQSEGPSSKTNRDDALADFEKNGRKDQAAVMGGISGAAPLLINHIRLGGREGGGALSTSDGSGASQAASIPRENKSSGFSSALKPMLQTVNGAVTKSATGGANATTEAKLHRMMAIMNSGASGHRGAAPFGAVGDGSPPSRTAMPLPDTEVPLQSGGAFSGTDVNYAASETMLPPTDEAALDPLQSAPRYHDFYCSRRRWIHWYPTGHHVQLGFVGFRKLSLRFCQFGFERPI
eukprot:g715.t1